MKNASFTIVPVLAWSGSGVSGSGVEGVDRLSGRGTTTEENAQGTLVQSHVSPSWGCEGIGV